MIMLNDQDHTISYMTSLDSNLLESQNVRRLLLSANFMHPKPVHDIEALEKMTRHLDAFKLKLELNENKLPHHERQIIEAAIIELKSHMEAKMRDIRRRMREQCEYE
jgi:hypothetical protein